MKVIGGKILPNTDGVLGAYIAKIYPGGVVDTLGEVKEGSLPHGMSTSFLYIKFLI